MVNKWVLYDNTFENFIDLKGLLPGVYYQFMVTDLSSDVNADFLSSKNEVYFFTKPKAVKITEKSVGTHNIKFSWNTDYAQSYSIYRSEGNNDFTLLSVVNADVSQYTDKELSAKTDYKYKITANVSNSITSQSSEYSNILSVKTKKTDKELDLPDVSGKCKTYAYYTAVTDKSSAAYAVLNSGTYNGVKYETTTDKKTGIRMVGEYYCAALGTYYGTVKGTKYKITLSNGKTFKIILCDTKSDRHTDSKHQYSVKNKDIIEFYVDKNKIPSKVRGSYNALPEFSGKIIGIEKL